MYNKDHLKLFDMVFFPRKTYVDIDEKGINTASAAAVRGVPTVVVYKKGIEVARKVGGLPEQQMRDFLKENL